MDIVHHDELEMGANHENIKKGNSKMLKTIKSRSRYFSFDISKMAKYTVFLIKDLSPSFFFFFFFFFHQDFFEGKTSYLQITFINIRWNKFVIPSS